MNQMALKGWRRQQVKATATTAALLVMLWVAWHLGWIDALNPFDGI